MTDDFEAIVEQPAAPADDFEPLETPEMVEGRRRERLGRLTEVMAATGNPDRRAAVYEVARKTGADPSFVEAQFDFWKGQVDAAERDPERLDREQPELASLMVDQPWLGQVVYQDKQLGLAKSLVSGMQLLHGMRGMGPWTGLAQLADPAKLVETGKVPTAKADSAGLEGSERYLGKVIGTRPATVEEQIQALEQGVGPIDQVEERRPGIYGEAFGRAMDQAQLGTAASRFVLDTARGLDTHELRTAALAIRNRGIARDYDAGPIEQVFLDAAEFGPSMAASYAAAGAGYVAGAVGGRVVGTAVGALAGPGGAAAGGQVGQTIGARIVAPAASFLTTVNLEMADLWENLDAKTDDGKPVPEKVAMGATILGAITKGMIETGVTFGVGLKALGPLGMTVAGAERKAIVKALMVDQTNWARLSKVADSWAKMALAEGFGEESAQSIVEDVASWLSKTVAAGKWQKSDPLGAVDKAVLAGAKGTVGAFVMGAGGAAVHGTTLSIAHEQSQRAAAQLGAIVPAIAESNTAKAAPEVFVKQILEETRRSGEPVTAAYVDPAAIVRFSQEGNMDPAEVVRDLAGEAGVQAFREALATGSKMEVPLQQYVEKWGTRGIAEALLPDTTTRPEFMTPREMAEGEKVTRKDIEAAQALIDKDEAPASPMEGLVEQLVADLVASKRWTKTDAKTAAKVIRKGIVSQAIRSGLQPDHVAGQVAIRLANLEGVQPETKAGVERLSQGPKDSPEFREWFGASKVVDEKGAPLRVIHGSAGFQGEAFSRSDSAKGPSKLGFWFTDDPEFSAFYGNESVPVFLSLQNPKVLSSEKWDDLRAKHGGDAEWFGKWRDELMAAGHDGLMVRGKVEKVGRFDFKTPSTYAAFEPTQAKSVLNHGEWSKSNPDLLHQDKRGFVEMVSEGTRRLYKILLGEEADRSTFFHEAGHIFLDLKRGLAERPEAPQAVKDDWAATLSFLGVEAGGAIETKHHEKWARAFEAYLYEGKAPSKALVGAFQQFKLWMREVYRNLSSLNVELDDSIRGVFDRMLATDEEISRAAAAAGMAPLNLSEGETKAHGDAMDAAGRAVETEAVQESLRVTEKWWRDGMTREKAAAFEAYKALPASKAWAFLRRAETSGSPALSLLVGEAKKARAKAKPEELNKEEAKRLERVAEKVAAIEAKRGGKVGNPLGPVSLVRKVTAVQVPGRAGSLTETSEQPLLEEWSPGLGLDADWKLVEVQLPEWLRFDDFMRDQEAWGWVWRTVRGQSASRGLQELLLFYAKQAVAEAKAAGVTPRERAASFSRLELVAAYFGVAGDTNPRKRSIYEKIAAWLALPKAERTQDPIPSTTWGRLFTREREKRAADWFTAAWSDRRKDVYPWLSPTTEAEAAKPKTPADLEIEADRARLAELADERRDILDEAHGRMVAEASPHLRLSYEQVADLVGTKAKGIFKGVVGKSDEALDPAMLANAVGAPSAAALLEEMERVADAGAWVKADAERRMAEQHPDVLEERSRLRKMAEKALHAEPTLSWLLRQGQDLRVRAKGKGSAKVEALRAAAEEMIAKESIGTLRAYRYLAAERSAARRKTGAVAAGDFAAAYFEWQKQVINYFLFREATRWLDERERFYKLADKMEDKLGDLGLASPVFRDVTDKVLVALGFKEALAADPEDPLGGSLSDLARKFEDAEIAVGYDETTIAGLLAKPKPAAELSVREMREVLALLAQIRAAAWRAGKIQFQGRIISRDALLGDIRAEMTRLPLQKAPAKAATQAKMGQGEKHRLLQGINAARRNPKVLLERLGPTAKAFFYDRLNAGLKVENDLTTRVLQAWVKAWDQLPDEMKRRRYDLVDSSAFPYPADVFREGETDREWAWIAALNMGNQSNENRLTGGYGWDANAFREWLLDVLTPEEWKFLQGVGDIMEDTLYKAMADEFEKHNGTRPEKIPPKAIVLRDGTVLRGWYFPAKYDPVNSRTGQAQENQAGVKEMQGRDYAKATMSKSFTKARVKEYVDVVDLSNIAVLTNHLFDVIHYVSFEGAVRDFNKVLPLLEQDITQRMGREYFWALAGWAQTVASPKEAIAKDSWAIYKALGLARGRFIFSTMAYNLRVALGDLSNPFTAMIGTWHKDAVRPDHIAGALLQANTVVGFPSMLRFARDSSEILKRDFDHQGQRLRDQLQDVGAQGRRWRIRGTTIEPERLIDMVHRGAYLAFHYSTLLTETVVWTAAYRDATGQGKDHAGAVAFADNLVEDNFPRGDVTKQPAILRSKQGIGSLLAFFGYFSTMENKQARLVFPAIVKWQQAEGFAEHAKAVPLGVKVGAQVLALYFVTNALGELLSGRGPDEDEEPADWVKRKMAAAPFTYQPFGGEVAGLVEGMLLGDGKKRRISERSAPGTAALSRFLVALEKGLDEDGEDGARFWATYEAGALIFKLPVSQVKRTVPYLWDVAEGGERPKSWLEFLQKSIYGANPNAADNPVTFIEEDAR